MKKRRKNIKSSKLFKIVFIFSFISSIICKAIAIMYLCMEILDLLNFCIISAILALLCMVTFGQYITHEDIECLENKMNANKIRIDNRVKKDK